MTAATLRTLDGRPVVVGRRLGRGGEGAVHLVVNAPGFAVKVYHDLAADRADRLSALIGMARAGAPTAVAWPRRLVSDLAGRPAGFIMEAFTDGRPVHELYTPLSRRTSFPTAGPAFLARAALNLARVVARLHDGGFVIGDLNHSSVLVLSDATVRMVDADSFPLPPDFVCPAGTPEYTPASLQGKDLTTVERQPHHDVFARRCSCTSSFSTDGIRSPATEGVRARASRTTCGGPGATP